MFAIIIDVLIMCTEGPQPERGEGGGLPPEISKSYIHHVLSDVGALRRQCLNCPLEILPRLWPCMVVYVFVVSYTLNSFIQPFWLCSILVCFFYFMLFSQLHVCRLVDGLYPSVMNFSEKLLNTICYLLSTCTFLQCVATFQPYICMLSLINTYLNFIIL